MYPEVYSERPSAHLGGAYVDAIHRCFPHPHALIYSEGPTVYPKELRVYSGGTAYILRGLIHIPRYILRSPAYTLRFIHIF